MIKQLGLIGYPLGHSFSKGFFAEKFKQEGIKDYRYDNYPISDINLLPELIDGSPQLVGLNVTIPYKQQVMAYVDRIDKMAQSIGAVNTLKINRSGNKTTIWAYNTDAYGFEQSLKPLLSQDHKKALVLGSGGASKAVSYVLNQLGIACTYVSRQPKNYQTISYATVDQACMANHLLIVNTTPLGMYPKTEAAPELPYEHLTERHVLYDLVYNPTETMFMKQGIAQGATVINGLEMLHLQAAKAWQIWTSS